MKTIDDSKRLNRIVSLKEAIAINRQMIDDVAKENSLIKGNKQEEKSQQLENVKL